MYFGTKLEFANVLQSFSTTYIYIFFPSDEHTNFDYNVVCHHGGRNHKLDYPKLEIVLQPLTCVSVAAQADWLPRMRYIIIIIIL